MSHQRISAPPGSVVIPAHDEANVIGRLLNRLTEATDAPPLEVTVVCNGCHDSTADVARSFGVRVIETPVPSKITALRLGDDASFAFPRLYVDADIEIDRRSVDQLIGALSSGRVLAAGPRRVLPMNGVSRLVRAYYAAWEELPAARLSLWGRGVIGIAAEAHHRVASMPDAMSDDLALSLLFAPNERTVVDDAVVVVHPPRTLLALLVRKERSLTGNRRLTQSGTDVTPDRTRPADLWRIARRSPRQAVGIVILVGVAVAGRIRMVRRDHGTPVVWGRDETSRAGSARPLPPGGG
jgi:hypothetical protein